MIPQNVDRKKVVVPGTTVSLKLIPSESFCPFCNSPLSPKCLKRRNALLLCLDGIGSVQTFVKTCSGCEATISYHDHELGVFNYDNNLVISFALLDRW